jgi:hypothetical protein
MLIVSNTFFRSLSAIQIILSIKIKIYGTSICRIIKIKMVETIRRSNRSERELWLRQAGTTYLT